MAKGKINLNQGELSTIIGPDAVLNGDLMISNSARIDGKVNGKVQSKDTITIGNDGIIEGDVTANHVVVGGTIIGNINATGRTVLEHNSRLDGNLRTMILVVEEGALFNGNSEMAGGAEGMKSKHRPRQITLTED